MKNRMMDEEQDVENVGIMQGFMDSMNEDEDEEEDEEEGSYAGRDRRPDSPEILMNNLRGDMRSIDARRDELADLVGYAAATETPEPVLAMLQPILAGQGPAAGAGGGIGALPPSMAMAQGPQPPMMPPPPPPMAPGAPGAEMAPPPGDGGIAALLAGAGGPPPGGAPAQPPLQMAQGGYVQRFQAGSSPAGVTPEDPDTEGSDELSMYPPSLVNAARTYAADLMTKQPAAVPSIATLMAERLPQYEKLIGADARRENAQTQMLLGLGQRAFNFAANVDDSGRPLRGGFFARLAGATRTLPSVMSKQIEAMEQIDLKLKTLAMQAAEKDQDEYVRQNTELLKRKSSLFGQVLQAQAKIDAKKVGVGSSIFGKGSWDWSVLNTPGLLDRYSQGLTDTSENNLVESAVSHLTTPRYETRSDPVTREPYTVSITPPLPGFVSNAIADRKALNLSVPSVPSLAPPGVNVRREGAPTAGEGAPEATPAAGQQPSASLWADRFKIAGPIAAGIAFISGIPGVGDPAAEITLARQQAEQQAERVIEALLKSTQGSITEQRRLAPVINIKPSAFQDPDAYGTRMIALGSTIQDLIREADDQGSEASGLRPEDKGVARRKAKEFRRIYNMLGLPPAVYTEGQARQYPPGTEVLWLGRELKRVRQPEPAR